MRVALGTTLAWTWLGRMAACGGSTFVAGGETGDAKSDVIAVDATNETVPLADGATDDTGTVDAATACDPAGAFGMPELVPGGVNSPDDDFAPRLSTDELTIYFARRQANDLTAPFDLYSASRATPL